MIRFLNSKLKDIISLAQHKMLFRRPVRDYQYCDNYCYSRILCLCGSTVAHINDNTFSSFYSLSTYQKKIKVSTGIRKKKFFGHSKINRIKKVPFFRVVLNS